MSKYVIVDLEMCNVSKGIKRDSYNWRNELIQIGAVIVDESLNITDEFMTLVSPEFGVVDNFIEKLTGISRKDVQGAPKFKEALEMFVSWLPNDAILVSWSENDENQIRKETEAKGIVVHKDNPKFSSKHNCLLTKNGKKMLKTCENSDVSKLNDLKGIGRDAFQTMGVERDEFIFRIPDGVEMLDYRAFAISADKVEITVPESVLYVDLLAFMIHSQHTHIIFEGDPHLRIGAFGTAAEAKHSGFEVYRKMPAVLYPQAENITVTCQPGGKVSQYCKEYGIPEV